MALTSSNDQSNPGPTVLGLDVGKTTITLHDTRCGRTEVVRNDRGHLLEVLQRFHGHDLAVCEATGGYEDTLLTVLACLAIPAHRADAAKVKAFLRSHGTLAKTDAIDARALARYGHDRADRLVRWTPAQADRDELAVLVERRQDLVAYRAAEKNRLQAPRAAAVAQDIADHIDNLTLRIRTIEKRITQLIADSRLLQATARTLQEIPGIGPTIAAILLAGLPELGHMNRRQAASLAGLAPHPRDSGAARGHRTTRGGRRLLRRPLFLAALTAIRKPGRFADAYNRLLQNGKPKRLALIAIARKIVVIANAKVRDIPQQLT